MPLMISLRNFRLETTKGHVVAFTANEPKFVPDAAVSEAMAAGCAPADKADQPFIDDLSRAKVEFTGDVRRSMIYLAIEAVVEKNDVTKDFDGAGVPRHTAVSECLGFEVFQPEVTNIFQQYLQAKSEDVEFALHASAPNIQRVMEAKSKAELVALAVEFGNDEKSAKGLVVRDLRKSLLVKLSGVAID